MTIQDTILTLTTMAFSLEPVQVGLIVSLVLYLAFGIAAKISCVTLN